MIAKRRIYYFILALAFFSSFFSRKAASTLYTQLSAFERAAVDEALVLHGLEPELKPEGKIIGNIIIFTSDPFSKESSFLYFLNYLHVNTKDKIIARELFQKPGDIYDEALLRDAELVLRAQSFVRSLSVIVPVKKRGGPEGGAVDLLVATRDILSLKPNFGIEYGGSALNSFLVSLGESNLLGYNKSISATYELKQVGHFLSTLYFDPRLFGTRLQLTFEPKLIFSKPAFAYDGFIGNFELERPLLSETDRWGYGLNLVGGSSPVIDFIGDKIRQYDILETPQIEKIDRRYRFRFFDGSLSGRRSFGRLHKKEVFSSYNISIKRPKIPDDLDILEEQKEAFKKSILPKDELESFLTLGFSYFQNRYIALYDYNNFKLQELKRTGPSLSIANDFSAKPILFSDYNFLRPWSKLSWLEPISDDSFILATLTTSNRYDGDFADNIYKFGLKLASPKLFSLARVILASSLSLALDNRDNQKFTLGSTSGLRGTESRLYLGNKAFRANLEIRSAPINLWITYVGLVLFYDVGSAFDRWQDANATHSLGFGLRVLAPQLGSELFRIDLGFPIYGRGHEQHLALPSFGTGQAF